MCWFFVIDLLAVNLTFLGAFIFSKDAYAIIKLGLITVIFWNLFIGMTTSPENVESRRWLFYKGIGRKRGGR